VAEKIGRRGQKEKRRKGEEEKTMHKPGFFNLFAFSLFRLVSAAWMKKGGRA
jgi:hypothetical protein